eukprot:jgi/Mesvir1/13924/Mv16045-RA.1
MEPAAPFRIYNVRPLLDMMDAKGWPEKTDLCCWWCCHPFDTVPCPLPIRYKEGRGFVVKGCFCSFSCVKAYNLKDSGSASCVRGSLLFLMAQRLWRAGKHGRPFPGVPAAPPRTCLKMFGGPMTIEGFRASCRSEVHMLKEPPFAMNFLPEADFVQKLHDVSRSMKGDAVAPYKRDPENAGPQRKVQQPAGTLALKRARPMVDSKCSLDKFVKVVTTENGKNPTKKSKKT